jgi:pheromone shutdown protein TraB
MPFKRSSLKQIVVIVVGALMVIGAAGWGLVAAFDWRFHPVPQIAKLSPPVDRTEATRQDLEVLGQLLQLDRSFSPEAAQQFEEERAKLIARAKDLTPQALEMQVSRLVALAGNGHTTVGRRLRRLNREPIRVAWFAKDSSSCGLRSLTRTSSVRRW